MKATKEQLKSIAEDIDMGQVCFLNLDTMEMESVMSENSWDDLSEIQEFIDEVYEKVDKWKRYIKFEPLESFESFKIMEHFVADCIPEGPFYNQLCNALSYNKPFHNFKFLIDNSEYRQAWFDYKLMKIMEHVKVLLELNENQIE
jgi:hypothetical protein